MPRQHELDRLALRQRRLDDPIVVLVVFPEADLFGAQLDTRHTRHRLQSMAEVPDKVA